MQGSLREITICNLVEAQVLRSPQAIAAFFGNQLLSYRELNEQSNQIAHYLQKLGVGPEILVGVCLDRSLDMIVVLLAILKAGGAYIPLDPNYPSERLAFTIEDAHLKVLITQQKHLEILPNCQAEYLLLESCKQEWQIYPTHNLSVPVSPTNLAYIIYTSGSTGRPKGVAIEHRSVVDLITWATQFYTLQQLSGVLASTSLCFDLSVFEIFVPLSCGGTIILVENAMELPHLLKREAVTLINTVPSAIDALEKIQGIPPTTTTINLAGEPLQNSLVQRLYQLEHIEAIYNLYGPSEDTTYSTVALIPRGSVDIPPIGYPLPNSQIYLLDESFNVVPQGVEGEIYIGGAGLARGYLNRNELTSERFIPNPFLSKVGERLYKTGDLAVYRPDGQLKFLGRIDHQVKIRGFRIEMGEIEAVLINHKNIRKAVVSTYTHTSGQQQLVAYIVPQQINDDEKSYLMEICHYLQQYLPNYMVPSTLLLLEDFPLTPNGKIDRAALPKPKNNDDIQELIYPRTVVEEKVANIWYELLGISKIDIYSKFCALGGNSLLSIQCIHKIEQIFKVLFPLEMWFKDPTIFGIANNLERLLKGERIVIPEIDLIQESHLDQDIQPKKLDLEALDQENPYSILLTGATGFLGSHLLHTLLKSPRIQEIYCLVQASSLAEGYDRLQEALQNYRLWNSEESNRIIPVLGDLSQPYLGLDADSFKSLSQKVSSIYHCGAWVNILYPYASLKAVNVLGTKEILRFAAESKLKPVHFVSTVDVFPKKSGADLSIVNDSSTLGTPSNLNTGYAISKRVAEQLIFEASKRGIPTYIYRVSNIMGHSEIGVVQENGFIAQFLKTCIDLKVVPNLNALLNLVPADYVSQAIVCLSEIKTPQGQAFNITNTHHFPVNCLAPILRNYGYSVDLVSFEEWYYKLIEFNQFSGNKISELLTSIAIDEHLLQSLLGPFYFEYSCSSQILDKLKVMPNRSPEGLLMDALFSLTNQGALNPSLQKQLDTSKKSTSSNPKSLAK